MTTRQRGRWGGGIAVFLMAGVLYGSAASVDVDPYNRIVERNVFDLHAPAPPVVDNAVAAPAIPKITLTGITTILGRKLVFLTTASAKPGAIPDSIMLTEGQGWNEVEVQGIDEKAGVVKVRNHGQSQTLNFIQASQQSKGPRF